MADLFAATLPHAKGSVADICRSLPGALLARGDAMGAREILARLIRSAGDEFVGATVSRAAGRNKSAPDILANFYLACAGYDYYAHTQDLVAWRIVLLPYLKRLAQGVIAGTFPGVIMGDSGLLTAEDPKLDPIELNVLWYNLMAMLAEELPKARDRTGDHFDRLCGRFRRSFMKAFWCDLHGALCTPEAMARPSHPDDTLEPSQLLAARLPFSAIPRTRQRQIVMAVAQSGRQALGVSVPNHRLPGKKSERVASPVHLAWLAEAGAKTGDWSSAAVAEARAWLAPLHAACEQNEGKLAPYYVDGQPPKGAKPTAGLTAIEVQRVWALLQQARPR